MANTVTLTLDRSDFDCLNAALGTLATIGEMFAADEAASVVVAGEIVRSLVNGLMPPGLARRLTDETDRQARGLPARVSP